MRNACGSTISPVPCQKTQPQCVRSLTLAGGQGLQTAAYRFRHIGGNDEAEANNSARQPVNVETGWHQQRQQQRRQKNHGDDRHAAPELE